VDAPLAPGAEALEVLREVARGRERVRASAQVAHPVLLLWLPPSEELHASYRDAAVQVVERLVADDPSVVLGTLPFPRSTGDPLPATTGLADLSLLAAPGAADAEAALALLGETIPESRALVFATGLAPEEAERLSHPRLRVPAAGETEPGGLFDALSRVFAAIRRVALWRALDPNAPAGDPTALLTTERARLAAHTDDGCVYLLALADRLPSPAAELLTIAGGGEALSTRLDLLLDGRVVKEIAGTVHLTALGRSVLRHALPRLPEAERDAEGPLDRLFAMARTGNQEALGRVLQLGGEEARLIARRRLGPALRTKVDSADITQSVMADLVKGFDQFEFRGEPAWKGYLRRLVENKIRAKADYFGAAKRDARRDQPIDADGEREPELPSQEPSPSDRLLREEEYARLEESLDRLPDAEREVLMLRVFQGMSHLEIAKRLDRPSENAVHKLYARALARLSNLMGRAG
jgi:RNA polymerase sigma-70 factor (ECF subfamily)